MKNISSRRAKALAIPEKVKNRVWERDRGVCVWCRLSGQRSGWPALPEAHYISRAKGGLGIEENVLTLCRLHHDAYDHGARHTRETMKEEFREYLSSKYPGWNEEKLIYHKEEI